LLETWIETGSKEFGNNETLKTYTAKRIAYKSRVLRKHLVSLSREKRSDVKPEQAWAILLACP
jgi:hypothetical protein